MTRRRRRSLVALGLLGLIVWFSLRHLPQWSAALFADRLAGFFHRPTTIGAVRYHLIPLELEVLDLRVQGRDAGAPPFLEIPRVHLRPSLAPLRFGRFVLTRVRVEGPRVRINAWPDPPNGPGGDDIPKMGGARVSSGLEVRIERFIIQHGEFILNHERVPLDLDIRAFRARLLARDPRGLRGQAAFADGVLKVGEAPSLPLGAEFELIQDGAMLRVPDGRLHAQGTEIAFRGLVHLQGSPRGQFFTEGRADLDTLDRHVIRSGFGMKGLAEWKGLVSFEGSHHRVEGTFAGRGGEYDGVPVESFSGHLDWGRSGVVIRELDLETLGGVARLEIDIPRPGEPFRVAGPIRGIDAERISAAIWNIGMPGLGAGASGDFSVSWPKGGSASDVTGFVRVDLDARSDGRTPLAGRFEWSAERGRQIVERADLRTPHTQARLAGTIERDGRTDLSLDAESTDVAAADSLVAALRRAVGAQEAYPVRIAGEASFRGRWRGTFTEPRYEGRLQARAVRWAGVDWGRAEWVGWLDPYRIESRSLVLRKGEAELWLDGWMESGYYGERDAAELRTRLHRWPAEDLIHVMDWRLDLVGRLSGDVALLGRRSAPRGSANVTALEGRWYGIPFSDAAVQTQWRAKVAELKSATAHVGGGTIRAAGSVTDDGVYDGELEVKDVDAGVLLPRQTTGPRLGGLVSGKAVLQGSLARPRLAAAFRAKRLTMGNEGLGATELALRGEGDGQIHADAFCRSPRVDLELMGTFGAVTPFVASVDLKMRSTSLDPFLRQASPTLPSTLSLVASGAAQLRGPLARLADLTGEAEIHDLGLSLPDYPVKNEGSVRLTLRGGTIGLDRFHLAGEDTDLSISGSGQLQGERRLAVDVRGTGDLRVISVLTPRLRGRGLARLNLALRGSLDDPQIQGELALESGGLRLRGFPHGFDGVVGKVRFTKTAAEVETLSGTLGGGHVEISGQVTYAGGSMRSVDLVAVGRAVVLRYPEGLRSAIDAELRLLGDGDQQWLSGSIDVRDALWTRRYDLASELLAERAQTTEPSDLFGGLRYDLRIRAPGTLRINNNLATLQARADLVLEGNPTEQGLVGRAEVDSGRLYFQGQTYAIRRGTIDFVNPRRVDPIFDIEAETRIRSYRVTLKVNGSLDRVTPTLSSDPPLSAVQILSLLAGADESQVASLTQAQTSQAQLAATGAATLAAGRLAEQIGLEKEAERVFGLNRFSIDPTVLRGGSGTTTARARVTVGKRITPDLSVLYSQDIRGTEDKIVSIEYMLSNRFSLLLTQSDRDGLAFDVRLRQVRR